MLVPRLVVFRSTLHQADGQTNAVNLAVHLPRRDLFDKIEQRTPVTIGHFQQRLARGTIKRKRFIQFPLGSLGEPFKISQIKAGQHQHLRPRQHRGVQLKTRVLSCGPDQQDRAIFHIRQKPVLLCLVETVNFVNEQERALAVLPPHLGRLKHLAQVRHARKNRTDLDKMQIGFIRQKPCDCGFADTGGTPENQRG